MWDANQKKNRVETEERGADTSFVTQELNLSDTSSRLDYWNSSPFQLSNKPRRAIVTLKLFQSRTVQREWRCLGAAVASQPTQRVFLSLFCLFSLRRVLFTVRVSQWSNPGRYGRLLLLLLYKLGEKETTTTSALVMTSRRRTLLPYSPPKKKRKKKVAGSFDTRGTRLEQGGVYGSAGQGEYAVAYRVPNPRYTSENN